jgi:alkylated DNA repair dioxygenase AlkB
MISEVAHLPNAEYLQDGGILCYLPRILSESRSNDVVDHLRNEIEWQHQEYYGKPARRGTAWFADMGVNYRYTGQVVVGAGWEPWIDVLRGEMQDIAKSSFNSVLLHRYPDGKAQMGWHADDEEELGSNPVIASLSFGAARTFKLRHKETQEERSLLLEHNSLLIMAGTLQHHWKHSLPARSGVREERFNLTFRYTIPS